MVIKVVLRRLDNRIVVLMSQYIDLNRDRGSSSSILHFVLYILCDVRRGARILHNTNSKEKKRKEKKESLTSRDFGSNQYIETEALLFDRQVIGR